MYIFIVISRKKNDIATLCLLKNLIKLRFLIGSLINTYSHTVTIYGVIYEVIRPLDLSDVMLV